MELNQALQEGQSFLRNGQEIAQRTPVNPDTLYMWDNQVQAIESFLANTEPLATEDAKLADLRKTLRDVKKQIELKVLEFELQEEGQDMPADPTEEEILESLEAFAQEVGGMLPDLEKAAPKDLKAFKELDDARTLLDTFLVESEPYVGRNGTLDATRQRVRAAKERLDTLNRELLRRLNETDEAGGDED